MFILLKNYMTKSILLDNIAILSFNIFIWKLSNYY